jgi:hypothetical protein
MSQRWIRWVPGTMLLAKACSPELRNMPAHTHIIVTQQCEQLVNDTKAHTIFFLNQDQWTIGSIHFNLFLNNFKEVCMHTYAHISTCTNMHTQTPAVERRPKIATVCCSLCPG